MTLEEARKEAVDKRTAVLEAVAARGAEVLVATAPATVRWLLCGRGRPVSATSAAADYSVLLDAERAVVLFPDIEGSRVVADERLEELGVELVTFPWHEGPDASIAELVGGRPHLRDAELEDAIAPLRRRLREPERERYRAAGGDAAAAVGSALARLDPRSSELDAAAELVLGLRQRGFVVPVALAGGASRQPVHRHPLPTAAPLGRHALLAVTAEREGLHVSLTRIVAFGDAPAELRRLCRTIAEIDARMLAASRPAATTGAVLEVAAAAYAEYGFPEEWRRHHQGGITGYAGREVFATPGEPTALADSCAVAWNPSLTGGGKSEDTALVTEAGVEVITRTEALGEVETSGLPRPAIVEL